MKRSSNDSGNRFEGQLTGGPGESLNEPRETPGTISAHLAAAAVAVVKLPGPIRFARLARHQQDDAVGSDPAMAIAKAHNLLARELQPLGPVVCKDEIIARTVHFRHF